MFPDLLEGTCYSLPFARFEFHTKTNKQIVFSWDELPGSVASQYRQFRGTSLISLRNKGVLLYPKGEDIGFCEKCIMCHQSNNVASMRI